MSGFNETGTLYTSTITLQAALHVLRDSHISREKDHILDLLHWKVLGGRQVNVQFIKGLLVCMFSAQLNSMVLLFFGASCVIIMYKRVSSPTEQFLPAS